jgi:hypothetical protein
MQLLVCFGAMEEKVIFPEEALSALTFLHYVGISKQIWVRREHMTVLLSI